MGKEKSDRSTGASSLNQARERVAEHREQMLENRLRGGAGLSDDNRADSAADERLLAFRRSSGGAWHDDFIEWVQERRERTCSTRCLTITGWVFFGLVGVFCFMMFFAASVIVFNRAGDIDRLNHAERNIQYLTHVLRYQHIKHNRTVVQNPIVFLTNTTLAGESFLQGPVVMSNGAIPGSGALINNKRAIQAVATPYPPGLNFVGQTGINFDGGNIVGLGTLIAQRIQGQVAETLTANAANPLDPNLQPGNVIGYLNNGTVVPGFESNPGTDVPAFAVQGLSSAANAAIDVRFSPSTYATISQAVDSGAVYGRVSTVDQTNAATTSAPGQLLAASLVQGPIQACDLQAADGTGANVVAFVYTSQINGQIYLRVCDLTNPAAPVCGPSTNTSTGDNGQNGVMFYDQLNSTAIVQTIQCHQMPADVSAGTPSLRRVAIVATADFGYALSIQIDSNVNAPLPSTIKRTTPLILSYTDSSAGNFSNYTNSLVGAKVNAVQLVTTSPGYMDMTWASQGAYPLRVIKQLIYINDATSSMNVSATAPAAIVSVPQNSSVIKTSLSCSAGTLDPSTGVVVSYTLLNLGTSNFGYLHTQLIQVPATGNAYVAQPYIYAQLNQYTGDLTSESTRGSTALATVAAVCSKHAIINYGTASLPQNVFSVGVSVDTGAACRSNSSCVGISNSVLLASGRPLALETTWGSLAQATFTCSTSQLATFVTTFVLADDFDDFGMQVYIAPGFAGSRTISYATLAQAQVPIGIVDSVNTTSNVVTFQRSGYIDLCDLPYNIDGKSCPYDLSGPVYACPSDGHLTFNSLCQANGVSVPAVQVGYTNIYGQAFISL